MMRGLPWPLQRGIATQCDANGRLRADVGLTNFRHDPRVGVWMENILTLGFLLLGLQQSSAQTLPSYDLSYYDSPKCIKDKANSFAKFTLIPNKPDEAVGKSICGVAKAAARSSRADIAKRWDTIPSDIRGKCINKLENDQKAGRIPMIDYVMLDDCINDSIKK